MELQTMKHARMLATLGMSAGLVLAAITVGHAAQPGMGGGSHPTGNVRHSQASVSGWGPHFERREGYIPGGFAPTTIPGAIKVPGAVPLESSAQPVKCPCTLQKDPLVSRALYGGIPTTMLKPLGWGVGAELDVRNGTYKNLLGAFPPATATMVLDTMITAWGPNFDPQDDPR